MLDAEMEVEAAAKAGKALGDRARRAKQIGDTPLFIELMGGMVALGNAAVALAKLAKCLSDLDASNPA